MHTIEQRAVELAKRANQDQVLSKALEEGVMHKEKAKQTSHIVYVRMLTSPQIGKAMLDATPVPGSKYDASKGSNAAYDIYDDTDPQTGRKIEGSFVKAFADNTTEGQAIATAKRNIAGDAGLSQPDKESALKQWGARQTALRSAVRDALRVHHRIIEVESAFPDVGVSLKTKVIEGKGETYDLNTTTPIVILNRKPRASGLQEYKYLSVGEFLSIKLDVAKVNAATMGEWQSLVKSGKKGKKKGGAAGTVAGARVARIASLDQFLEYSAETAAWLDDGTGTEKGVAQVLNRLSKMPAGEERKHTVLTLYRVSLGWDMIYRAVMNEGEGYALEQSAINAASKNKVAA